jgi:hypothetical protein
MGTGRSSPAAALCSGEQVESDSECANHLALSKHEKEQLLDNNASYTGTHIHDSVDYTMPDKLTSDYENHQKYASTINAELFTSEELLSTVEVYVSELLHVFEEGNMKTFSPQEFASTNGYIVAKSLINDRISYIEQNDEGVRHLSTRVQIGSIDMDQNGNLIAEAEGTIRYSAYGYNQEIKHNYNDVGVETLRSWYTTGISFTSSKYL